MLIRKLSGYPLSPSQSGGGGALFPVLFSLWPYRAIRLSLAAFFLWSGGAKLMAPTSFAFIIEAFGLIPDFWVLPVAVALPALEVAAGLGMIVDLRGSLGVIAGLLTIFMAIVGYGILVGLDIDCGCFGPGDPEAEAYHGLRPALYRDFLMMAGIGYLYLWRHYRAVKPIRPIEFIRRLQRASQDLPSSPRPQA